MNRPFRSLLFILQCVVLGLAGAFVLTQLFPSNRAGDSTTPAQASPGDGSGPVSYARAVRAATPAVVNIYANSIVTERPRVVPENMRHLFPGAFGLDTPRQRVNQSLGSGVIVGADGHILTTYHVVAEASDIQVALSDGRVTRARVVGSDRDTDLAVLKIEGSQLPAARFAPENALQVGDVVLAIGNPFGIGQRVTMGIVSATGNNRMNLLTYDDFIQTDAAINDGNSGGALVNAAGELVGINTAVFRFGEGIGFAIPAQAARRVLDQILTHGRVIRGWLGLDYRDTPAPRPTEGEQTQAPRGVLVTSAFPGFPGAAAGIQPGDVILQVDGKTVDEQNALRQIEAALSPGSAAAVEGLRAGVPFAAQIQVAERPQRD